MSVLQVLLNLTVVSYATAADPPIVTVKQPNELAAVVTPTNSTNLSPSKPEVTLPSNNGLVGLVGIDLLIDAGKLVQSPQFQVL